jgi:hypothetical protein
MQAAHGNSEILNEDRLSLAVHVPTCHVSRGYSQEYHTINMKLVKEYIAPLCEV